ncbi:MAG: hypothetical protein ABI623_10560 [bacterium]
MKGNRVPLRKLVWMCLFAAAFAFVESSVVVYLRALYYPEGFSFPLKVIADSHVVVEVCREAATLLMLASVGIIAGRTAWQRFGYFCIAFGVWDIFYYVWLKLILGWPASFGEWDILFLIPLPWIGPVASAVAIALLLVVCGFDIVVRTSLEKYFKPQIVSWMCALAGTAVILYSFMHDTDATLRGGTPLPYHYDLLAIAVMLYVAGYVLACRQPRKVNR